MGSPLLSLALSGLGRDAIKAAVGLLVGLLIALAFAISSVMALLDAALPGIALADARVLTIPAAQPAVARVAPSRPLDHGHPAGPSSAPVIPATGTARAAVLRALGNLGSENWFDADGNSLCEQFVENMYGTTGQYPTAIAAWRAQVPSDPNQLAQQRDLSQAPAGATVYFSDPQQPAGHTGIYLGNGGFIAANDNGVQYWDVGAWQRTTDQSLLGWVGPIVGPQTSADSGGARRVA